jgi:hypothetical protein
MRVCVAQFAANCMTHPYRLPVGTASAHLWVPHPLSSRVACRLNVAGSVFGSTLSKNQSAQAAGSRQVKDNLGQIQFLKKQ